MDMNKPHKGVIEDWEIQDIDMDKYPEFHNTLGFVVSGRPISHPDFEGWMRTSIVLKREGSEIETYNSRYTLGKEKNKE